MLGHCCWIPSCCFCHGIAGPRSGPAHPQQDSASMIERDPSLRAWMRIFVYWSPPAERYAPRIFFTGIPFPRMSEGNCHGRCARLGRAADLLIPRPAAAFSNQNPPHDHETFWIHSNDSLSEPCTDFPGWACAQFASGLDRRDGFCPHFTRHGSRADADACSLQPG